MSKAERRRQMGFRSYVEWVQELRNSKEVRTMSEGTIGFDEARRLDCVVFMALHPDAKPSTVAHGEFYINDGTVKARQYILDPMCLQLVLDAADARLPRPITFKRYRYDEWWVYAGETIPLYLSGTVPQPQAQASHAILAAAIALTLEAFMYPVPLGKVNP